jgi:hypothetical protein
VGEIHLNLWYKLLSHSHENDPIISRVYFFIDQAIAQEKTMADRQETQQERETRWTAQRAANETQQQASRAARARARGRNLVVGGAIVIIVVALAVIMLL